MVELAENRMGGVNGTTLPAIQTVSSLTQAQVLQTTQSVAETIAYARGVGETAAALAEVARDNALSGSGSVPAVPEPPPPPYYEPPV